MKNTNKDTNRQFNVVYNYSMVLEIGIHFAALLLPAWLIVNAVDAHSALFLAFMLMLSFYLYSISILLLVAVAIRLLPKPEKNRVSTPEDLFKFVLCGGLRSFVFRTPAQWLMNVMPFPGYLYYKIIGASIHPTASFIDAIILDPYAVTIGENTIVGKSATISGHYRPESDTFILGDVIIGNHVMIGANSLIWPDVVIEDHAVIGAYSMIKPGTRIKAGEVWAGIPARKIKDIPRQEEGGEHESKRCG